MKEIYSFSVDVERDVEETEVSITQTVKKEVPIRIILKEPNRRDIEEADMEFSIEMSKCIKRGILTKAMLAKKYSDTGGILTEEDAKLLTRKYGELGDLQNKYTRIQAKSKKTAADNKKSTDMLGEMAATRREILNMETAYSSLFNHTADTRAQSKIILWYLVNLSFYQENEEDEIKAFFTSEEAEDKIDEYYDIDENGHDIFDVCKDKLSTFISFWYFSTNSTTEDFDLLNKDIEEGNLDDDAEEPSVEEKESKDVDPGSDIKEK